MLQGSNLDEEQKRTMFHFNFNFILQGSNLDEEQKKYVPYWLGGGQDWPDWMNKDNLGCLTGGLSSGGVMGLCAGMACKKAGKVVATGFGGL
jgi:hypothetical protein